MKKYVTILNENNIEIKVEVPSEVYKLFEDERKEQERLRKEKSQHASDEDVEGDIVRYCQDMSVNSVEEQAIQRQELKAAFTYY